MNDTEIVDLISTILARYHALDMQAHAALALIADTLRFRVPAETPKVVIWVEGGTVQYEQHGTVEVHQIDWDITDGGDADEVLSLLKALEALPEFARTSASSSEIQKVRDLVALNDEYAREGQ